MAKQHEHKLQSLNDFPDQPIRFDGEIVAVTKMKTDGFRVKISLSDGTYLESNCGNDTILFGRLCKMFELGKRIKIIVE